MKKQENKSKEMKFEKFEIASIEKLDFISGGGGTNGAGSEDTIIETEGQ